MKMLNIPDGSNINCKPQSLPSTLDLTPLKLLPQVWLTPTPPSQGSRTFQSWFRAPPLGSPPSDWWLQVASILLFLPPTLRELAP